MAEDVDDDLEAGEDAEGEVEGGGKKKGKKTLFIIIGIAVVVVIGGAAGAWFTGLLEPVVTMITGEEPERIAEEEEQDDGQVVFLDLPEILVNLNTGSRKATYLKIRVSLELQNQLDVPRVELLMNRIMDTFTVYLRELRIDDLKGSAGMYRLREELLLRVSSAVAPARVNDVLFKEMLVQ